MKVTESALRRPVTTLMVFLSFIVVGWIASRLLPLEFFPSFEYPYINVNIPYSGSTPEEVERQITRPVEEVLATISGVKRMISNSGASNCSIFLEFDWGVDSNVKAIEVREKIDGIRPMLPSDLERFYVTRQSMQDMAVLTVRISSQRDLTNSYDLLNRQIKRRIERISGVSSVRLYGVEPREIRIQLLANRIIAHQVDLNHLAQVLAASNFTVTAGRITDGNRRFTVRPVGEIKTPEEIGALIVGSHNIKLRDIAHIKYDHPELDYARHLDQKLAIGLDVYKESGANVVDVAKRVKREISSISQDPKMEGISLYVMFDTGEAVVSSLNELLKAGLIGALLAVVVLFIFLRQWKTTLIVAMAVPVSILVTLAFMHFFKMTLNILSMTGLMLAVGMLVDNAVVVSENIYRHQKLLPVRDKQKATLTAVKEVALAITAGTSTTAIVFLPNVLNEQGEISIQIKHVAVAFCIALGCSLALAQTVVPLLSSRLRSTQNATQATVIDRMVSRYKLVLDWLLRHRRSSVALVFLVLVSVALPFMLVKKDMFPTQENRELNLFYNINDSYTLEKVKTAVDAVEEYLYAHQEKFRIESVYTYYTGNSANSTIILRKGAVKHKEQIKNDIREGLPQLSIASPAFEVMRFGGGGGALRIQLIGPSTEQLVELSQAVAWTLERIPGFKDVRSQAAVGQREVHVKVNRERAKKYGLSPEEIARNVSVAMRGVNLRRLQGKNGEILVRVEFQEDDKKNLEQLHDLTLFKDNNQPVKLAALADFEVSQSLSNIRRENRITSLGVTADLKGLTLNEARTEITQALNKYNFPSGYSWSFGRSFSFEDETIKNMMVNTLLALALIYIVMASLFESLVFPAAIWSSILFAIVGVWWFFLLTGTTFDIMAWFGVLILIGVVVNNGIVLIDYINQLRGRGMPRHEAMVKAGGDRLRPIIMTAATTVFSLLPLCLTRTQIGGNGPPYFPMARAIVGGLVFSTLVTLIILPTIYILLDDLRNWSRRVLYRARPSRS